MKYLDITNCRQCRHLKDNRYTRPFAYCAEMSPDKELDIDFTKYLPVWCPLPSVAQPPPAEPKQGEGWEDTVTIPKSCLTQYTAPCPITLKDGDCEFKGCEHYFRVEQNKDQAFLTWHSRDAEVEALKESLGNMALLNQDLIQTANKVGDSVRRPEKQGY